MHRFSSFRYIDRHRRCRIPDNRHDNDCFFFFYLVLFCTIWRVRHLRGCHRTTLAQLQMHNSILIDIGIAFAYRTAIIHHSSADAAWYVICCSMLLCPQLSIGASEHRCIVCCVHCRSFFFRSFFCLFPHVKSCSSARSWRQTNSMRSMRIIQQTMENEMFKLCAHRVCPCPLYYRKGKEWTAKNNGRRYLRCTAFTGPSLTICTDTILCSLLLLVLLHKHNGNRSTRIEQWTRSNGQGYCWYSNELCCWMRNEDLSKGTHSHPPCSR